MIATFFEWAVDRDREDNFVAIWTEATALLLKHGSLGSALFRTDNGHFCALARWPDRAARDLAFARLADESVFQRLRDCITQTIRQADADEVANQWRWP